VNGLDCIAALKALGEETRLRILRLLFREQLSVNEISERLKVSQYNVSKHLRIMRGGGLARNGKAREAAAVRGRGQTEIGLTSVVALSGWTNFPGNAPNFCLLPGVFVCTLGHLCNQ
jgi:predicted transcriptional regulator